MTGGTTAAVPVRSDFEAALAAIRGSIRTTPLERSHGLSDIARSDVYLKLENLQRTGSFKVRGALRALTRRVEADGADRVVTASAGNHGLGLAFAARALGVHVTIFVPRDAPRVKRERIGALGADLRLVEGDYDDAHAEALAHARREGMPYIHAYSDPDVVTGQGTVALEILERLPEVATVVVPIGGGGLVGGVGGALRALAPGVRVIGAQSEATRAMHDSWRAGRLVPGEAIPTLCDGLSGDTDEPSLRLASAVVDDIVLVTERSVEEAIRSLYLEEGLTVEGSAAVGVAAIREGRVTAGDGPTAVVITGGNIDASLLADILRAGAAR
jgi:threonine dehydratase